MQTILLYDPQRSSVTAEQDQDHWFRAGRIATVPLPMPGEWLLRLAGTGAYSVAVQAHAIHGMHSVELSGAQQKTLSLRLSAEIATPRFRLISPAGEVIQDLQLESDPDSPGRFRGTFQPAAARFRILVENGAGFQRVDPRLFEAEPVQ
jgi:hypothetical protein